MNLNNAYKVARAAMEKQYDSICTVYERRSVEDDDHITRKKEVAVLSDIPCRLSYRTINTTNTSSGIAEQSILVKLFINPDVEIKAGSKIVITTCGREETYQRSGMPAIYPTHQEIMLTNFERWA